jgi:type II secretion system protein C
VLGAAGVSGLLAAFGVNRVVAAFVAPETAPTEGEVAGPGVSPTVTRSEAAPRARSLRSMLDGIMRRNAFDPTAAAAWAPKAAGGAGDSPITDLKVKLLGTIVAVPDIFSSALIYDETTSSSFGYGLEDKLYDATVVRIEAKRVTIRRGDGTEEILSLGESEAPRPTAVAEGATAGTEEGISKVSETEYTISRETFDKYMSDIEGLSKLGRGLLHRAPDGGFDGYRLTSIRRNSVAEQLGIRNGDIVHAVNGQSLDSVQSALSAYNSMGSQSNFSIEVTRRGEKVNLQYSIQ